MNIVKHVVAGTLCTAVTSVLTLLPCRAATEDRHPGRDTRAVNTRSRLEAVKGSGTYRVVTRKHAWDPSQTAIIVCDMWNNHHCKSAARRVVELMPHMNDVIKVAREKGMLIIHAPSACMKAYEGTPQRKRAQAAAYTPAQVKFQWNRWNESREGPPFPKLSHAGCSCDTPEPCGPSKAVWTRQIAGLVIADGDAITDRGQEVYNLITARGIEHVIIMGVHTNVCVLSRPFGIRQLVYLGVDVVLCRDLTDSYHRDPGRHFQGLNKIIEHIEKHWCPTITSTVITGKPQFRFEADR